MRKLAEKIVDAIILGWNIHGTHFTSKEHCIQVWEARIKEVQPALPSMELEEIEGIWLASLKGCKGMVVQGETKEKAIDELMISIKVKLMYEYQSAL